MSYSPDPITKARIIKASHSHHLHEAHDVLMRARVTSTDLHQRSQKNAEQIMAVAQNNAQNLLDNAQKQATDLIATLQIEEKKKASDAALHEILDLTTKLRQELSNSHAEIIDLVRIVLEQIIGAFDKEDLLKRVIIRATSDLREKYGLKLCVHPSIVEKARIAVGKAKSESLAQNFPIDDVFASENLAIDEYLIVSSSGAIDISLKGQLERMLNELKMIHAGAGS